MKRRDALALSLSAGLLPANDLNIGPTTSDTSITVRSPKDGFVETVNLKQNDPVQAGVIVVIMDDDDEQRLLTRLNAATALVEIEARALADDQVAQQRELLTIASNLVDSFIKRTAADETIISTLARVGSLATQGTVEDIDTVNQLGNAASKLDAEKQKLAIALKTFEFSITQAKDRNAAVSQQLREEISSVKARIARLSVKAPSAGRIQAILPQGAWVSKGDVVALIV